MGHDGKHIIDPETGLCEICDKNAILEIRQGKRPGKQVFYSNHDDRDEIPYTKDRYIYEMNDESTPRHVRKSIYPAPTVRSRRVIYEQPIEEPVVIRRKPVRRDRSLPEEVVNHHPPPRPTAFYYVDQEGQIIPQNEIPPPEPSRRYVIQSKQQPPARTVRVVHRRAQTPPPPVTEIWHSEPRRKINSDTEIIERQQRIQNDDSYYDQTSPIKPEMYYIEGNSDHKHHSSVDSAVRIPYDNNTPPPKMIYQGDENRRQRRLEPLERKNRIGPEPTVVRRVYKKVPPGKYDPPHNEYISNENNLRSSRKTEKIPPPPRRYTSSPQFADRNNLSPEPAKNPAVYYLRPVDNY